MARENNFISLGELLEEVDESPEENEILERVKILAQENLPDGWIDWEVLRLSKEEVFGKTVDPQILNKLRFCLPTVQLARAFDPEISHLSEKSLRNIKLKLLDWAFARALILSPPAITNKIRGSAAASEIFKAATKHLVPQIISQKEAGKILESESECGERKRRHSSVSSGPSKKSKIEELENRMNNMFSTMMNEIKRIQPYRKARPMTIYSEDEDLDGEENVSHCSEENDENAYPSEDSEKDVLGSDEQTDCAGEFEFLPDIKEAEPKIPEPSPEIKSEGISCQRLGSEGWNRIRYKDVEKKLHASPVFSSLKTNPELCNLGVQGSRMLERQDGILGTITHGLLKQRKSLSEELKKLVKAYPETADHVKSILHESSVKETSDDVLHYVCARRAETIEIRRRDFVTKNEALKERVSEIPPSTTHLFDERKLADLIKDSGGVSRTFISRQYKKPMSSSRQPFRKPEFRDTAYKHNPTAASTRGGRSYQPKKEHPLRNTKPKNDQTRRRPQKFESRGRSDRNRR